MQKQHYFFCVLMLVLLISSASASIFSIDDAEATISIKTVSTTGAISKDVVTEKNLKIDTLQTIQIQLSKIFKTSETKTVQLYPFSFVVISSDFAGITNIMQTSTKEGYPLIEVYYGYQKSRFEPWQYYFRIERVDKDNAYVIYADFSKKSVWLGTIQRSTYDTIVNNGGIPDWTVINGGEKDAEKI